MIKILFLTFLFIVLIGFLFGFAVLRGLKRLIFGPGPSSGRRPQANHHYQQRSQKAQEERKDEEPQVKISRKLFEAEKGEYVDYEEIKE